MIVSRFYEPAIAQASYLIGCVATGEAIVIDPNRDVGRYIAAAAREGVTITHVTETHIHADFLSGARELAARTGAKLLSLGRRRSGLEVSVRLRRHAGAPWRPHHGGQCHRRSRRHARPHA